MNDHLYLLADRPFSRVSCDLATRQPSKLPYNCVDACGLRPDSCAIHRYGDLLLLFGQAGMGSRTLILFRVRMRWDASGIPQLATCETTELRRWVNLECENKRITVTSYAYKARGANLNEDTTLWKPKGQTPAM
jgi:hypothetical protein